MEHTQRLLHQSLDHPLEPQYLQSQLNFLYLSVNYPQQRVSPSKEVAKNSLQGNSSAFNIMNSSIKFIKEDPPSENSLNRERSASAILMVSINVDFTSDEHLSVFLEG